MVFHRCTHCITPSSGMDCVVREVLGVGSYQLHTPTLFFCDAFQGECMVLIPK